MNPAYAKEPKYCKGVGIVFGEVCLLLAARPMIHKRSTTSAFGALDVSNLEKLCSRLGERRFFTKPNPFKRIQWPTHSSAFGECRIASGAVASVLNTAESVLKAIESVP